MAYRECVHGLLPAQSDGDIIVVFADGAHTGRHALSHTASAGCEKAGRPTALADFIAPKDSGVADYLGLFAVTAGLGGDDRLAAFEKAGDDHNAIMFKALADRLPEAFGEAAPERVRKEFWGMRTTNTRQRGVDPRRASRHPPGAGLPACPDHRESRSLPGPLTRRQIGIGADRELRHDAAGSVSGFYFHHPAAQYFHRWQDWRRPVLPIWHGGAVKTSRRRRVRFEHAGVDLHPSSGNRDRGATVAGAD